LIRNNALKNSSSTDTRILRINEVSVNFKSGLRLAIKRTEEFKVGEELTIEVVIVGERGSARERIKRWLMVVIVTTNYSLQNNLL
jgi:hypothetical protein